MLTFIQHFRSFECLGFKCLSRDFSSNFTKKTIKDAIKFRANLLW